MGVRLAFGWLPALTVFARGIYTDCMPPVEDWVIPYKVLQFIPFFISEDPVRYMCMLTKSTYRAVRESVVKARTHSVPMLPADREIVGPPILMCTPSRAACAFIAAAAAA